MAVPKNIEAKIPVLVFREGSQFIVYSPALDISTCGDTEGKARTRFTEAVRIFLHEVTRMGTLAEVLEECGWSKIPGKQEWCPPAYKTTEEAVSIPVGG
ncbi:MAG TPA: type II toxin-antitoxin system HicB family antitoxin [Dehalococcoidia bacterium]|nr:type II toxin-antitoxin system HicB family antitoxin [Dehalococcoidia bacterium]